MQLARVAPLEAAEAFGQRIVAVAVDPDYLIAFEFDLEADGELVVAVADDAPFAPRLLPALVETAPSLPGKAKIAQQLRGVGEQEAEGVAAEVEEVAQQRQPARPGRDRDLLAVGRRFLRLSPATTRRIVERAIMDGERLVADAEVLTRPSINAGTPSTAAP